MIYRRKLFQSLAGIVVGGAGARVIAAHDKPQNKPVPVKSPVAFKFTGGAYGKGDGFSLHKNEVIYYWLSGPEMYIPYPRMNARITDIGGF